MGKAKRKPRPQPPGYFWLDRDNCWRCKNKNNCTNCKALKRQRAKDRQKEKKIVNGQLQKEKNYDIRTVKKYY